MKNKLKKINKNTLSGQTNQKTRQKLKLRFNKKADIMLGLKYMMIIIIAIIGIMGVVGAAAPLKDALSMIFEKKLPTETMYCCIEESLMEENYNNGMTIYGDGDEGTPEAKCPIGLIAIEWEGRRTKYKPGTGGTEILEYPHEGCEVSLPGGGFATCKDWCASHYNNDPYYKNAVSVTGTIENTDPLKCICTFTM